MQSANHANGQASWSILEASTWRSYGAIASLGVFTLVAFLISVVGIPWTLIGALTPLSIRNPMSHLAVRAWVWGIKVVGHDLCLGIRIKYHDDLKELAREHRKVVISNHPTTIGSPYAGWLFVSSGLVRNPAPLAKLGHLQNPLGWAMWLLDIAIFVDRSDSVAALRSIARGVARKPWATIVNFADKHRPTREVLEQDRVFSGSTRQHVGNERYKGLQEIIDAIGEPTKVVDVTTGFSVQDFDLGDVPRLVGATLHVWADTEMFYPKDPDGTKATLARMWDRKERRLSHVRSTPSIS